MTLRSDIRDYFEREAAAFAPPAGLRPSVTAEAARTAGVDRGGMRLAAVVAGALSVAIVAGLLYAGSLRHSNPPVPVVKPGQHGIVLDADTVDQSHGWALLGRCPAGAGPNDTCTYWVESTSDGGQTWAGAVKIGAYPLTNGDAPRHIHFGDNLNGFVYGNGVALATHDGGLSWTPVFATAGEIVTIAGRGSVWAVLYPCSKGTQCAYEVVQSGDSGRSWGAPSQLPAGFSPRNAVAVGDAGLILSSFGVGDMAVTSDLGRTWTVVAGRCAPDAVANYVASADGVEIWQYCGPKPVSESTTADGDRLWVSEDSGATWKQGATVGAITTGAIVFSPVHGVALMITSSSGAVPSALMISRDSGRSWTKVDGAGSFTTMSFAKGAAWAVDSSYAIWVSYDIGATWSRLPAQP